ncbi:MULTISPECIES: hypothetical protein [unclassified Bradyrhizobium]|uniref:hypothetical protein n=1 Tax=unclassified Bradyrhizobium TaxID=2631580 RepID=UPI0032E46E3A
MVKAADMMIARRADTQARADVATWKMMAKLNGADTLPAEAQGYLAHYHARLQNNSEADATDAIIAEVYQAYYAAMGGNGAAPVLPSPSVSPATNNVTPFQRPKPKPAPRVRAAGGTGGASSRDTAGRPRVPAFLIFVLLVIVVAGAKYLLGW